MITARIEALPLSQLEELAMTLLDFEGPRDLMDWLRRDQDLHIRS